MDTFQNMRVFLLAAKLGSFSAAARKLRTTPSVVAKRIDQLEYQLGVEVFKRSTRSLALTNEGAELLPRCLKMIAEFEELTGARNSRRGVQGRPRVRIAGAATAMLLAPVLCDFVETHPNVELDVEQPDNLSNPLESGCDIAIGLSAPSYRDVIDFSLAAYPRTVCASPRYLADRQIPRHPRELMFHECLTSPVLGSTWRFVSTEGEIAVDVRARLSGNNSILLREALSRGMGIAMIPSFLVAEDIRSGALVKLLDGFAPSPLWLKALVPEKRFEIPIVRVLLGFIRDRLKVQLELSAA
jgi:DNA-binding transcriptional LysR family regulator